MAEQRRVPSRHQGSRLVPRSPNVVRTIGTLREQVKTAATKIRPETLTFVPVAASKAEPCTGATLTATHTTLVLRSGKSLFVHVLAWTGTDGRVEARLAVPDLGVVGATVATPTGGTRHSVRLELELPASWAMGEGRMVEVQARRAAGTYATALAVVRSIQR